MRQNVFKFVACISLFLGMHFSAVGQTASLSDSRTGINAISGQMVLNVPDYPNGGTHYPNSSPLNLNPLNSKVKSARLFTRLDLGEHYSYGDNTFALSVGFSIQGKNGSVNTIPAITNALSLNKNNPEAIYVYDFTNELQSVKEFELTVTNAPVSNYSPPANLTISNMVKDSVRLVFYYEIEYMVDVRTATSFPAPVVSNVANINSRVHTFNWGNTPFNFPNYEFELLRLYNVSGSTERSQDTITAVVDWAKALRIETGSSDKFVRVSIAEGTGFYIWRVRPVGNFYEGGISNFQNWGQWSQAPQSGTILNLRKSQLQGGINSICYFNDPDEEINWIYSRVFTEGNKVSEKISYANGLNQLKQTQAHIQSSGNTVVAQTFMDFSGRPALNMLPVPVTENGLQKYKPGFVKDSVGNPYTANHFEFYDASSTVNITGKVDTSLASPYSYYSDNNSDLSIPSAEGYPFSRTLFYNDGTGRVKEQSGPGKTFSMGSQTDGKGRTIRTLYSTPSEDELVRVFGDEAPLASSVFKTTTIDGNNTQSVTYTSKEGHVIATCLIKNDGNNLNPLSSETGNIDFEVNNRITTNVPGPNGFISTKRLSFSNTTKVEISYTMDCENLPICSSSDGECSYIVEIFIHNISKNFSYSSGKKNLLPCAGGVRGIGSITWAGIGPNVPQLALDGGHPLLPQGNYIIEKRIQSAPGAQSNTTSNAMLNVAKSIKPLIDKISFMLDGVNNENDLINFYAQVETLSVDIQNQNSLPGPYTIPGLDSLIKNESNSVSLDKPYLPLANPPSIPGFLNISAGCCNSMSIPIAYDPPFQCFEPQYLRDFYDTTYNIRPHKGFLLDFEGFAQARLNPYLQSNSLSLSDLFPGYNLTNHEFNFMIYHMLTDNYFSGKTKLNTSGVRVEDNGSTNGLPIIDTVQYDCQRLWGCWVSVVSQFENAVALNSNNNDNHNVAKGSDESNDESSSDPNNTVDNKSEDNARESPRLLKWLLDWLTKKNLQKELRKDRSGPAETPRNIFVANLPKLFMDCAGYKFAEILPVDKGPSFYPADKNLYDSTKTVTVYPANEVNAGRPVYPYVRDAKYMFKYFVYTPTPTGLRTDVLFPAYIELEYYSCFSTLPSNLCEPPPCAGRTNVNWSSTERRDFYEEIIGQLPVVVIPEDSLDFSCPSQQELDAAFNELLDKCNTNCDFRRADFRNKVVQMFLQNCYVIGGCATDTNNVVTEEDIKIIVDALVADCKAQCDDIGLRSSQSYNPAFYSGAPEHFNNPSSPGAPFPKTYTWNCLRFNGVGYDTVSYCEGFILPKCEAERIEQIRAWNFIPQIADCKCSPVKPLPDWWGNITADPCNNQSPANPGSPYSKTYQLNVTVPAN